MVDSPVPGAITSGIGLGLRWAMLDEVLDAPETLEVDFFEISPENYMGRGGYFPDALREVAQTYPIRTHGLMMNLGGPQGPCTSYLDSLRDFLHELGVDAHSDHLCWSGTQGQILHDLLPLPLDQRFAQRVADQIQRAQDHLGLPLAVENISYYATLGSGSGLVEADFITEVLQRADCPLLLDVNNVWVNAQNHGFDPYAYLARIPLERVVEIHVAGGERLANMQDLWIDTHGADVAAPILELMQWVLRRCGPCPVLYERDHKIPPLPQLLDTVTALRRAYRAALDEPIPRRDAPPASDLPLHCNAAEDCQIAMSRAILGGPQQDIAVPMEPARLQVYRQLVHNGVRGVCRRLMPRVAARRGEAFERDLDAWLAGPGPRSARLRDLPEGFLNFIAPRWIQDAACPVFLGDLARLELAECAADAAPDPRGELAAREVQLSDSLVFHPAVAVHHYAHAVHRLPQDPQDRTPAEPQPCDLLLYRDADHEVRFLELSAMARGLLERLLAGQALGQAVQTQAQADGTLGANGQIEDSYLQRILTLLGDLSERGALLGPASGPAQAQEPGPAPTFRAPTG